MGPYFSRRTFLRGTAGTAIALPALPSLGQTSGSTKRFIAYCQPLGTFGEMFFPHGPGETPYAFPNGFPSSVCSLSRDKYKCRERVFRSGSGAVDRTDWVPSRILAPLERHRDDLLVLEGVNNYTGNHKGYAAMLTGASVVESGGQKHATSISVDQVIANAIGQDTKFASLQFGVRSSTKVGSRETVSWFGSGQGAPPENNPAEVFRRVFSDVATPDGAVNHVVEQRRSILDAAIGQAESLRGRLGAEDRQRVEMYLTSVREVERRVSLTAAAGCQAPEEPDFELDRKGQPVSELTPMVAETQLDLLALSMACDLTRVATYQMGFEATNMTHPWLGVSGRWHDLSHNGGGEDGWWDAMDEYVRVSEWNATLIAGLLDRLKNHGIFDDTAVLWINPMHNGQIHNSHSIPLVVAGSAGGFFRTGRHVRYAEDDPHDVNDLHVMLLRSMGIEADRFGAEDGNRRPLEELAG